MFNAQQFAARLATRKDRWSLLKNFVAEWHKPLQEGDGYSVEEIDEAESRLGLTLPLALREWYLLAGRRQELTNVYNWLLPLDQLMVYNGVLAFYVENQACCYWGILLASLHLPDPPVVVDLGDGPEQEDRSLWLQENATLSEFILQMVLYATMNTGTCHMFAYLSPEEISEVARTLVPLGFPEWHWLGNVRRFFGESGVLALTIEPPEEDIDSCRICITAHNHSALERIKGKINMKWEHG